MSLALPLALPKLVRYEPDSRLELVDIEAERVAMLDTFGAHNRAIVGQRSLGAPDYGEFGWVLQGFQVVAGVGLQAVVSAMLGVAIDSAGRLIINEGASSYNVTLAPSTANVVYAYLLDIESDPDGRRRWDRLAVAEASFNANTRLTPTVGFYVDGSLRSHAIINGQTVPLVPLCLVTTDGVGVTGVADSRPFFGNPRSTFAFDTSNLGLGIQNLHDLYSAIAKRIKEIQDPAGFWHLQGSVRDIKAIDDEVLAARTPAASAISAAATLKKRIEAARTARLTVGPTDTGDYNGASGLATALNRSDGEGDQHIHVKAGLYNDVDHVSISARQGVVVTGVPSAAGATGVSRTEYKPLPGAGKKLHVVSSQGVVFDGLYFNTTGKTGEWEILIESSTFVVFRNCEFYHSNTLTGSLIRMIGTCKHVLFENCHFASQSAMTQPLISIQGNTSYLVETLHFVRCRFDTYHTIITHQQTNLRGFVVSDCHVIAQAAVRSFDFVLDDVAVSDIVFERNYMTNSSASFLGFIRAYSAVPTSNGNGNRTVVRNNYFVGAAGIGVLVGGHILESQVCDNTFASGFYGTAIKVYSTGGSFADHAGVLVRGNTLFLVSPGVLNNVAIDIEGVATATEHRFVVQGNTAKGFDFGVRADIAGGGLIVQGNTLYNCTKAAIQVTSPTGGDVRGLSLCDNVIDGGGTSDNNQSLLGSELACSFAILVPSLSSVHRGTQIRNNQITRWAQSLTTTYCGAIALLGGLYGVAIDNNTIKDCGNTSGGVSVARRILFAQILVVNADNASTALSICKNVIDAESWGALVYFDPGTSGTDGLGLDILKIDDNILHQQHNVAPALAVKIGHQWGGMTSTQTNIKQASVSNNDVYCAAGHQALYNAGVIDLALDTTGANMTQRVIRTNNNSMRVFGVATTGIYHRAEISSVVIGNNIENPSGSGGDINTVAHNGTSHIVANNATG